MLQSAKTRALETSGDHSGVNSHKVLKKNSEADAGPSAAAVRLKVHAGHNNSGDPEPSGSGEQTCSRLRQVRLAGARGQVDELGGGQTYH